MKKIIDSAYYSDTDCGSTICIWVYANKDLNFDHFWLDNPADPKMIETIVNWLNSVISGISYESIYEMYNDVTVTKRELGRCCADEISWFGDFNMNKLMEDIPIPSDRAFAYECARLYGLM